MEGICLPGTCADVAIDMIAMLLLLYIMRSTAVVNKDTRLQHIIPCPIISYEVYMRGGMILLYTTKCVSHHDGKHEPCNVRALCPLVRTFDVYGPPIDRVSKLVNSKHFCLARAVRASLFVSPQTTPTRWAILSPFGRDDRPLSKHR